MIIIKSQREIGLIREAGKIVAQVFDELESFIVPGITTNEIAKKAEQIIRKAGGIPASKGYNGFPGAICTSVNDVIVHGIPNGKKLVEGDIVSCDVVVTYKGYNGDACRTFRVGKVSEEADRLIKVTEECLQVALNLVKPGVHLSDISAAIQYHAETNGYSIVREFTGHGIGKSMHEDPMIPNYGEPGHGPILKEGMTLAIEPMVLQGRKECYTLSDGWTTKTMDGKLASHHENTIVVTKEGYEILTKLWKKEI